MFLFYVIIKPKVAYDSKVKDGYVVKTTTRHNHVTLKDFEALEMEK